MSDKKYLFPLSIQLTLPDDHHAYGEFKEQLALLQEFGFSGVELNIADPQTVEPKDMVDFLRGYGLSMTMFPQVYPLRPLACLSLTKIARFGKKRSRNRESLSTLPRAWTWELSSDFSRGVPLPI